MRFFEKRLPWADNSTVGLHNFSEREHWVEQRLLSIPSGARILDAGAGECQYRRFCTHLEYVSQDFSQYDGSGNSAALQQGKWDTSSIDIVSDICDIPEKDQSFDAILCTEVFEHLPDPQRALKEFSRLLRPGGVLLVTAPFCSLTHFAPYHFSTGFNRYFYTHYLEKFGFSKIEISENGNYFEFMAQELRRLELCAEQYSGIKLKKWQKWLINMQLSILERLSSRDSGSKELLNFGLHVKAIRA